MGTLRLLLALAVVLAHAHAEMPFHFLPDSVAVASFFMISGFYMGLILDTKYGSNTKVFLWSRALRIYPLYFLVLLLALILFGGASWWKGHPVDRLSFYATAWENGNGVLLGFLTLIQTSVLGIDWASLLSCQPASGWMGWGHPGTEGTLWMERLLFLPHAWTLGFELLFYLLVPGLNRLKTPPLLLLLALSCLLKILLRWEAGTGMPTRWDHQFFPPQFCFFLAGHLAHRHRNLFLKLPDPIILTLFSLLALLAVSWPPLPSIGREIPWFALLPLALPRLFAMTASVSWDNWLGSLSYPLYLIHVPVRWLFLGPSSSYGSEVPLLLYTISSVLAAILLAETAEKWIEIHRAAFIQRRLASGGSRSGNLGNQKNPIR